MPEQTKTRNSGNASGGWREMPEKVYLYVLIRAFSLPVDSLSFNSSQERIKMLLTCRIARMGNKCNGCLRV